MLHVILLLLCAVQLLHADEAFAPGDTFAPGFCTKKYVKPGEDFKMICGTAEGVRVEIYNPDEVPLPSHETLQKEADEITSTIKPGGTWKNYTNANAAEHAGNYTCIVYFGPHEGREVPSYTMKSCEVFIVDLCEDVVCQEGAICVADYTTGEKTTSCECVDECGDEFDPVCSDDCKLYMSECLMKYASCKDNVDRKVAINGYCPRNKKKPEVNQLDGPQTIEVIEGENINLSSGLVTDGVPSAVITWTFFPINSGEIVELEVDDPNYMSVAAFASEGQYVATVEYCAAEIAENIYNVEVDEIDGLDDPYVCSVFPGGVIESFDGNGIPYDLACTHVLAADVMAGGDYTNPWFIYGTFDQHEGDISLASMTFFVGSNAFEFQRGWVINNDGIQFEFEENAEEKKLGDSGCLVEFRDFHLRVKCEHFQAYYDGIMSGHIRVTVKTGQPTKGRGNLGLCYDAGSGWRPNWQVNSGADRCTISTDDNSCPSTKTDCEEYKVSSARSKLQPEDKASRCEAGPTKSCMEINCGDDTASPVQTCALQQAARVMCALKNSKISIEGNDDKCPEDGCEWKKDVLSRGCPHDDAPFVCP